MKKKSGWRFSAAIKYLIVVVVVMAVFLFVRFFSGKNNKSYVAPMPSVVLLEPEKRDINVALSFSGHIEARSMIPVIPLVSGIVTDYPIKTGFQVEKKQVLAVIDQEPFRQQMLQAKAAFSGYESSFIRVAQLYTSGAATQQEYDTVKAQRDAAKAQYDLAELQLGYATVTSPIQGTVLAAPMTEGSVANPQQPVAIVANLSDLVVRLNVPEKYFEQITLQKDNLKALISRPEEQGITQKESAFATVDTVAPYVDATSKTFEVVLKLTDVPETFKPGMYAKVDIIFSSYQQVPALPVSVLKLDGSCYVFSPDSYGKPEIESNDKKIYGVVKHFLVEDVISDGKWFIVPEELSDNLFVVQGQNSIFDGQPVSATIAEGLIGEDF